MFSMQGVTEPQQDRSARTLSAVLDATEALLATIPPDSVSLSEICRRAGVTTGAFYSRFRDREALFRYLEEQTLGEFDRVADAFVADTSRVSLRGTLELAVTTTADLYRRRRGSFRALSLRAPQDEALSARMLAFNARLFERVIGRLARHAGEILHPEPTVALQEVLVWIVNILRQQILFNEQALRTPSSPPERLVDLVVRYLTCPVESGTPPPAAS